MREVYLYKKLENKKVQCRKCVHPKEILKDLYINKKLSMEKISKIIGISISTVFHWLHKYNIPIRRFKYQKYNFSGDPKEKAYILGLVSGDLYVYRHCRQIGVELTTTHPRNDESFLFRFRKIRNPHPTA